MLNYLYKVIMSNLAIFYSKFLLSKNNLPHLSTLEDSSIIISLTTYHKRFSTVRYTLESLFRQDTNTKYTVYLVLSQEDINKFGSLPTDIERYLNKGLNLKIVDENLKSYKKAFYTYDLNKPIITVDDDVFYPNYWLKFMLEKVNESPDTILAYRGHYIINEQKNFLDYNNWLMWSKKNYIKEPLYSFLPTGTSGIYYPINSLKGLKENKEIFLEVCENADDLFFKYLSVLNGFKSKRIFKKNIHFFTISQGESLFDSNVLGGENDIQFKSLLKLNKEFSTRLISDSISI